MLLIKKISPEQKNLFNFQIGEGFALHAINNYKIIDEDGNGELSYEEISNLVFTSLKGHRELAEEDSSFFKMLS